MSNDIFYTVTDKNTQYTNSRSRRYATYEEAVAEAQLRLTASSSLEGVYIMKAHRLVVLAKDFPGKNEVPQHFVPRLNT